MIIARWQIDARFGHKQIVIDSMKRWLEDYGTKIGWKSDNTRLLTGSVGARESTIVTEHQLENLAELNAAWDKLATLEGHAEWSKELEPHVVNGSNFWEIYRVL